MPHRVLKVSLRLAHRRVRNPRHQPTSGQRPARVRSTAARSPRWRSPAFADEPRTTLSDATVVAGKFSGNAAPSTRRSIPKHATPSIREASVSLGSQAHRAPNPRGGGSVCPPIFPLSHNFSSRRRRRSTQASALFVQLPAPTLPLVCWSLPACWLPASPTSSKRCAASAAACCDANRRRADAVVSARPTAGVASTDLGGPVERPTAGAPPPRHGRPWPSCRPTGVEEAAAPAHARFCCRRRRRGHGACGTVTRCRRRRKAGDCGAGGSSRMETRTNCAQSATPPTVSTQLVSGPPTTGATTKQLIDPAAGTNRPQRTGSSAPPALSVGVETAVPGIPRIDEHEQHRFGQPTKRAAPGDVDQHARSCARTPTPLERTGSARSLTRQAPQPTASPVSSVRQKDLPPTHWEEAQPQAVIGGPASYPTAEQAETADREACAMLEQNGRAGVTLCQPRQEWTTDPVWSPSERTHLLDNRERTAKFVGRYGDLPIRAIDDLVAAEWLTAGRPRQRPRPARNVQRRHAPPGRPARRPQPIRRARGSPQGRGRRDTTTAGAGAARRDGGAGRRVDPALVRRRSATPLAHSGARPGEWDALKLKTSTFRPPVRIERQWNAKLRKVTLPKHDHVRTIAMTDPVRGRLLDLPRESELLLTMLCGPHYTPSLALAPLEPGPLRRRARADGPVHRHPPLLRLVRAQRARLHPHEIALQLGHRDGGELCARPTGTPTPPSPASGYARPSPRRRWRRCRSTRDAAGQRDRQA